MGTAYRVPTSRSVPLAPGETTDNNERRNRARMSREILDLRGRTDEVLVRASALEPELPALSNRLDDVEDSVVAFGDRLSDAEAQIAATEDLEIRGRIAQLASLDITTDINPAVEATVPISGVAGDIVDSAVFVLAGGGIRAIIAGRFRAHLLLDMVSDVFDASPAFRFAVNGVAVGPQLRAGPFHPGATASMTWVLSLAVNDTVTVRCVATGVSGAVTMASAGSGNLMLEGPL